MRGRQGAGVGNEEAFGSDKALVLRRCRRQGGVGEEASAMRRRRWQEGVGNEEPSARRHWRGGVGEEASKRRFQQ